jgi:flavodoxin
MIERRLIVYYSWIGSTKVVCEYVANQTGIPILRIEEANPRPLGKIMGAAMGSFFGVSSKLKPMDVDMSDVKTLILGSPVWAGKTPPAINAFLKKASLSKKDVWILMTMGEDKPPLEMITALASRIEKRGGTLKGLIPFRTHWEPETNQPITEEEIRETADRFIERAGLPVLE